MNNSLSENKQPLKRAIFIDRDGTIIREPEDEQIDSLEKLEFIPGAITALSRLANSDFDLVMVSNQDGLGTDSFPEETFHPAHNKMLRTLEGEGVKWHEICIDPHFEWENAPTRKPATGMLTAYMDGSYDLANSYVIGDRESDMQLARNLGAQGLMIREPGNEPKEDEKKPDYRLFTDWNELAWHILSPTRKAYVSRNTSETKIEVEIDLDGNIPSHVDTGLKFFDHMLYQLPHHAGIGLRLICKGDLEVDEHHTMEDVAIALGETINIALGDKKGIERYGFVLPMDESAAMVLIDLGGRSELKWDVTLTREYVGDTPTEMYPHFFKSLATAMHANIHIQARGENTHHIIEGVFKAFAHALKEAIYRRPFNYSLPSSKGVL